MSNWEKQEKEFFNKYEKFDLKHKRPHLGWFYYQNRILWSDLLSKGTKDKRILDYGCGDGRNLTLYLQNDFYYFGVDISFNQLKRAKRQWPNGCFVNANSLEHFNNGSFDFICCLGTLHHICAFNRIINGFRNVLKSEGCLYLQEPMFIKEGFDSPNERALLPEEVIKVLEDNHFEITKFQKTHNRFIMKIIRLTKLLGKYESYWKIIYPIDYMLNKANFKNQHLKPTTYFIIARKKR